MLERNPNSPRVKKVTNIPTIHIPQSKMGKQLLLDKYLNNIVKKFQTDTPHEPKNKLNDLKHITNEERSRKIDDAVEPNKIRPFPVKVFDVIAKLIESKSPIQKAQIIKLTEQQNHVLTQLEIISGQKTLNYEDFANECVTFIGSNQVTNMELSVGDFSQLMSDIEAQSKKQSNFSQVLETMIKKSDFAQRGALLDMVKNYLSKYRLDEEGVEFLDDMSPADIGMYANLAKPPKIFSAPGEVQLVDTIPNVNEVTPVLTEVVDASEWDETPHTPPTNTVADRIRKVNEELLSYTVSNPAHQPDLDSYIEFVGQASNKEHQLKNHKLLLQAKELVNKYLGSSGKSVTFINQVAFLIAQTKDLSLRDFLTDQLENYAYTFSHDNIWDDESEIDWEQI
jgi:hypothetical protein